MKIVYLNTTGTLGGAELCLLDIVASLKHARPDWDLCAILGEDGPLRREIEVLGASCHVLPLPHSVARLGDASLRGKTRSSTRARTSRLALALGLAQATAPAAAYVARLKKVIRREQPNRIHTINLKAHILAAWAAGTTKANTKKNGASVTVPIPVIWHLHDYINSRPIMVRLLGLAARPGVCGVGVSRSVAEDAEAAMKGRIPVSFEYNAVDLSRFAPEGPALDLDAASGLPPAPTGTIRLGLVATFAHWKGHDVFLEAAARVMSRVPAECPCRFYIVGGPIYRTVGSQWSLDELRTRAQTLGLNQVLGLTGHQNDPSASMRALDVIVHASTRPSPLAA